MRVFLFDTPGVKALKLAYTATALTLSGCVPAENLTIDHSREAVAPDLSENEFATPHIAPNPKELSAVNADEIATNTVQSLKVEAEDKAFSETVTFAQFQAIPGFACHAQLAIGVDFVNGIPTIHETFSRSVLTKNREAALEANHHYIAHILVPCSKAKSFDDCALYLQADKDAFTCDVPFTVVTMGADVPKPKMTIDGPDAITSAGGRFTVTYFWPDTSEPIVGAEVWSEVTAGYVNRQRVHTDASGKAVFTVLPLALDKGESLRLKFGLKHYTGKVQKIITVS